MQPHVLLYTRRGCHLCDQAREVLKRFGLTPEEVDIDREPSLISRYGDCVPVVSIDGQIRFRGVVHDVLLRRLLRGRQACGN